MCAGVGVGSGDEDERDAMQLWFEARWARLVAQRRARELASDARVARLQRRLARPLSGTRSLYHTITTVVNCLDRAILR